MPQERDTATRQQLPAQLSTIYIPAGFYMLRAPVLSTNTFKQIAATDIQTLLDNGEELEAALTKVQQQSYGVLKELIARPEIEQALLAASTSLFEGIRYIQNEEVSHRIKRAYHSILRYLVRMSTRPTPFGLFSGVTTGILAENTTARLATPPVQRIRTRPGMNWLFSIIQRIEQDENLIPQLHVVVNHTAYCAGTRAIIPLADVYGQRDQRLITLRMVPALQYVLDHARQPIAYRDLRDELLATFTNATEQQMDGFLRQLWEHHVLISNLRPPLTNVNPAKYVLEQLSALPGAASTATMLREVLAISSEIDHAGTGGSAKLIHILVEQQEQLVHRDNQQDSRPPFQIDTALRLENPRLNADIGEAAAQAAEALLRLGPAPRGFPHLREYHAAFLERYGVGAEVPVLDLLSPETGLDAPSGYTEPPREYPLRSLLPSSNTTTYDSALCSLLTEAVNKRVMEIELTDQLLERLAQWNPQMGNPPAPLLEVYLQLHASSREALDRGEWRAVVGPATLATDGRTFCRFFDIMGDEVLERLRAYIEREESLFPDVIFAELSYLPISGRGANVAVRPALRSYEIVVNTTPSVPPDRVIPLHDLVVGASLDGFYIRSQKLRKKVIVCQGSMLNIQAGPNVCRFLLEVSMNMHLLPTPFHWGIAHNAPFLPRIVRDKIILSPAQWTVQTSTIVPAGDGSDEARWFTGLQQWREQWRVPRYVYLMELDNLLLLDLEHPLMVAELRAAIKKSGEQGAVRLREMLPDFEHLWLRDGNDAPYITELVIPLIVRKQADTSAPATDTNDATVSRTEQRNYAPRVITYTERRKLPGDEWTFLKLYTAIRQYDEIIANPLHNVVRQMYEQGLIDRWFYIRYSDPGTHLRVRFHATSSQTREQVLISALTWSRTLVERELVNRVCVDSYDREIERYGGPAAIDAIETVFTADSATTSELVAALYKRDITLDPLAVAVFSLDQLFAAWGLDFAARLQYIQSRTRKYEANDAFRARRKLLCEMLAPWDTDYDADVQAQREQLRAICTAQASSINEVACQMHTLAADGKLWQSEENILGSLAHMHINRLLGFGRDRERQVYQLWRHTLESVQRRPASKSTPTRGRMSEEGYH